MWNVTRCFSLPYKQNDELDYYELPEVSLLEESKVSITLYTETKPYMEDGENIEKNP